MQFETTNELEEFFLDIEIADQQAEENDIKYSTHKLSFPTNKYTLEFSMKFQSKFNKKDIDEELSRLLVTIGHPVNQEVIDGLITLFCLSKKQIRNKVLLGKFFQFIRKCKLKQYMFFRARQDEEIPMLKFRDFYIGGIDYNKFTNFINNHTSSDFPEIYKAELSRSAGVEVKNYEIKIVDILEWALLTNGSETKLEFEHEEIINSYLTAVSKYYYSDFKGRFYKQQEFINSYFGVYYPLDFFEKSGYTLVNVFYNFLNNARQGWVLPISNTITHVSFPDPRIIKIINQFLAKNEGEIYESRGEFARYLNAVSNMFSNAEKQITQKNFNHAFVDFFVGLDFLLAPNHEKSKVLKERIALLVHKSLAITFNEQLERLNILYNIRNGYVHEGKPVEEENLIELRNLARVVLAVVLEVHKISLKSGKLNFSEWVKGIDEFVQEINKGNNLKDQQFSTIGIKPTKNLYLQSTLDKYSF